MYDAAGLGIRIALKRRELGLTQEALAERLGLTAQAVSKWETGIGYPDVTILPELAGILGMSIDELFGADTSSYRHSDSDTNHYPDEWSGMKKAAQYNNFVCYSDVEVDTDNGKGRLTFVDGSEAVLSERVVINRGSGNIVIVSGELFTKKSKDEGESATEESTGSTENIRRYRLDLGGCAGVRILPSESDRTDWHITGSQEFVQSFDIEQKDDLLTIRSRRTKSSLFSFISRAGRDGVLTLYVANGTIDELEAEVSGAVDFSCSVPCIKCQFVLRGGGLIHFADAGRFKLKVSGAGRIRAEKAHDADITINGAGDVSVDELSGECKCKISGAGSFSVKGNVDTLELSIGGAGSVNADDLTVRDLDVRLSGAAGVRIGRVTGQSRERISALSSLHINQRGSFDQGKQDSNA
jgi:transcriptional regulator with XRE-family HTH domain